MLDCRFEELRVRIRVVDRRQRVVAPDLYVQLDGVQHRRLVFERQTDHVVGHRLDAHGPAGVEGHLDLLAAHLAVEHVVADVVVAALDAEEHLVAAGVAQHAHDLWGDVVGAVVADERHVDLGLVHASELLQPLVLPGEDVVLEVEVLHLWVCGLELLKVVDGVLGAVEARVALLVRIDLAHLLVGAVGAAVGAAAAEDDHAGLDLRAQQLVEVEDVEVGDGEDVYVFDERADGVAMHGAVRIFDPEAEDAGVVFAGVHLLHQFQEGHLAFATAEHVYAVRGDDFFGHGGRVIAAGDDLGAGLALEQRRVVLHGRVFARHGDEADEIWLVALHRGDELRIRRGLGEVIERHLVPMLAQQRRHGPHPFHVPAALDDADLGVRDWVDLYLVVGVDEEDLHGAALLGSLSGSGIAPLYRMGRAASVRDRHARPAVAQ